MLFSSTDTSQDFDPEAFLETLSNLKQEEPPYRNPSPPDTPLLHVCPIHTQEVHKRETDTQWGHWEYFRCPVQGCFVCCGAPQIDSYLNAATQQLQDFYRPLPLEKMKCYCSNNLNLCLSNSERNPGRLFFKCSKRECDFFQWANEYPKGKIRLWLEGEKFIYMFDGKIVKRTNIPLLNLEIMGCPKYDVLRIQSDSLLPSCGFHKDDTIHHCPVTECHAFWKWYQSVFD